MRLLLDRPIITGVVMTTAMALAAGAAVADRYGTGDGERADAMSMKHGASDSMQMESRADEWRTMQDEHVELSELMNGDLSNGLRALGQVEHVVLSDNASKVQYIVYEPDSLPWDAYASGGYFEYQDVDLMRRLGDVTLRIDANLDPKGPEELRITADEAEYRLASRVTDSRLETKGERFYEIEDLLINRDTGNVAYFVIGAEENALFSDERRAVPANRVTFRNGEFRTSMPWSAIEDRQPYDPGLL
jgi:hypothetical protein